MEPNSGAMEGKPLARYAVMRPLAACAVAAVLGLGTYWTLRLGYADRLFHVGTPAAQFRARELARGNAAYHTGPPGDTSTLKTAVEVNPRYSPGWIDLGSRGRVGGRSAEGGAVAPRGVQGGQDLRASLDSGQFLLSAR